MEDTVDKLLGYIAYAAENIIQQGWGAVAGFLLGVSVNVIGETLRNISKSVKHIITNRRIGYLENKAGGFRLLEYGPSIAVGHDSIRSVSSRFLLPMPDDAASYLTKNEDFTGSVSTKADIFGSDRVSDLGDTLGIDNIGQSLEAHIQEITKQFVEGEHGISFNSVLYGVRSFKRLRHGPNEQPKLRLECFETDYYTFKVMDSFHREIVKTNREKSLRSFSSDNDINYRLYPFLTSIGLNFIVISCDDEIILTRRSGNIDRFGIKGEPIYPSFNEALATHDLPYLSGLQRIPSIPLCFQRGLSEELGLKEFEVEPPTYRFIGFGDIGIGFGVYGYARTSLTAKEVISRYAGQDRVYESSEVFSVPLKKRRISKIIRDKSTGLQVIALLHAIIVDFDL